MQSVLKRELVISAALLVVGVFLLPFAVYLVGQPVFGPYEAEGGLSAFLDQIWLDLIQGEPVAWLLALSPFLVIQLARLGHHLARRPDSERRHSSDS